MPAFNKINGFVEHLAEKVHDLGADQLVIALTNTAPAAEASDPSVATADAVVASLTEIAYTNVSSRNITTSASAQASGTYKLTLADLTLNFTGAVGPFRYVYIYNDTPTSPADPLIAYYDYGSSLSFISGESLTIDFDDSNGAFTIA